MKKIVKKQKNNMNTNQIFEVNKNSSLNLLKSNSYNSKNNESQSNINENNVKCDLFLEKIIFF